MHLQRSCYKLVHLCSCNMLVPDVSFRDIFWVWDGRAIIDRKRVAHCSTWLPPTRVPDAT